MNPSGDDAHADEDDDRRHAALALGHRAEQTEQEGHDGRREKVHRGHRGVSLGCDVEFRVDAQLFLDDPRGVSVEVVARHDDREQY
jgi:hypothetical protein